MRIPLSHRVAIAESVTGTAPVVLRGVVDEDLPALRSALKKNAEHLAPWTPAVRGPMPWSLVEAARTVARHRTEWEEDRGYALFAFAGTTIVGKVALSQVVRGGMEGAYLGYWVAGDAQGRGLATALVAAAVEFAFATAGLHRVQAAVMPRNFGSLRVLAKNGFREEGLALRYLQIAGKWEDHTLFARTIEDDGGEAPDRRVHLSPPGEAPDRRMHLSPPGEAPDRRMHLSPPGEAPDRRVHLSPPGEAPDRRTR